MGVGGGGGKLNLCAETLKPFTGLNVTVPGVEGMHQFTMYVYPVSRTTGEERAECSKGGEEGGEGNSNRFRPHKCKPDRNLL